jgi:hypothetical protein
LIWEAWLRLAASKCRLRAQPFRAIAPALGHPVPTADLELSEDPCPGADRIGWAVRTASRYTLWTSGCLPQAIAAKQMLRRRGLPSTVYFGMARTPNGTLRAHAWVRAGATPVVGGRIVRCTVLGAFADHASTP